MRSYAAECTPDLPGTWFRSTAGGGGENDIDWAYDYEGEADKELTWSVRRAIRREAVFGFMTPFVTALPRADVAWRRDILASSIFFSATAAWTFLTRLLRAPIVARFRAFRFTDWRARRIVDLCTTGIVDSYEKTAHFYHRNQRSVKVRPSSKRTSL